MLYNIHFVALHVFRCRVKAVDLTLEPSASLSVQQDSLSDPEDSRLLPQRPLGWAPVLSWTPGELWLLSVARRDKAPLELKDERTLHCNKKKSEALQFAE